VALDTLTTPSYANATTLLSYLTDGSGELYVTFPNAVHLGCSVFARPFHVRSASASSPR